MGNPAEKAQIYSSWERVYKPRIEREKKSLEEGLDITGRKIKVGDTVAYAVSLGRSAGMQVAQVVGFNEKGKPQLKIDERFRKTYGDKSEVTVQYFDRMVIIDSLPIERLHKPQPSYGQEGITTPWEPISDEMRKGIELAAYICRMYTAGDVWAEAIESHGEQVRGRWFMEYEKR